MKRKRSKIYRVIAVVLIFIALCSFVSYICNYPSEALKASCGGIGAFVIYCIVGTFVDKYKRG